MTSELKNQVEAILFAAGKKVTYEELARLCNTNIKTVKESLLELKKDFENRETSLLLTEEADGWKLTVKERFLSTVRELIPETELTKSVLETLAVIAWKHPVMQSTVVRIRTNKAYDHIGELEELGFITKEKKGRSFLIKVTQKFQEYFDLPGREAIKQLFKNIQETEVFKEEESEKLGEFEIFKEPEGKEKKVEDKEEVPGERLGQFDVYTKSEDESEEEKEEPSEEEGSPEEQMEKEKEEIFDEKKPEKLLEKLKDIEKKERELAGEDEEQEEEATEESSEEEGEKPKQEEKEKERKLEPELERFIAENQKVVKKK